MSQVLTWCVCVCLRVRMCVDVCTCVFLSPFAAAATAPAVLVLQFVRIVRHQWLVHCLKPALPKDVLDKSWPECPLVCQEASAQLRALHQRTLVRHYVRSLTAERKQQLTWKLTCRDTFKDKKSVYSSTVPTPFSQSRIGGGKSTYCLSSLLVKYSSFYPQYCRSPKNSGFSLLA